MKVLKYSRSPDRSLIRLDQRCSAAASLCPADTPQEFPCYLFWCLAMLAADIFFEVTWTEQSICLIPIMETNKCSMSNFHHCMFQPTRHSRILDLCSVSVREALGVNPGPGHPPETADLDHVHFICVSCSLLKMFRHGLMILLRLSRAALSELQHLKNVVSLWVSLYIDAFIPNNDLKVFSNGPRTLNLLNEKQKAFEDGDLSERETQIKTENMKKSRSNMKINLNNN